MVILSCYNRQSFSSQKKKKNYNVTYTTYREVTKIWDDVFEGVVEIQLYKVTLYSVYIVLMDSGHERGEGGVDTGKEKKTPPPPLQPILEYHEPENLPQRFRTICIVERAYNCLIKAVCLS